MLNEEWPIRPSFLSLAKDKDEETADFNTQGIYYPDYIRGFLADLSHDKNVHSNLSMFQVVPEKFVPIDDVWKATGYDSKDFGKRRTVIENYPLDFRIEKMIQGEMIQRKKIIRIDNSGTFGFHPACLEYRKCDIPASAKECYKQDSRVGIFADPSFKSISYPSPEYKENLNRIINEFNKQEEQDYTRLQLQEDKKGHLYVTYICRMSYMQETMFPVFAKGRFVACLMLGQKQRANFDSAKAFTNCPGKGENCNCENCTKVRSKLHKKNKEDDEWKEMVNTILNRIDIFQNRLDSRIDHRNDIYINETFKTIQNKIKKNINGIKIKENDTSSKFYAALSEPLTNIHEKFGYREDGFIRMFALPMNDESDKYIPIGWSSNPVNNGTDFMDLCKKYVFEVKKQKDFISNLREDALIKKEMADFVNKIGSLSIQKECNPVRDTIIIKKLTKEKLSYIIWERDNNNDIIKDKNARNSFEDAVNDFYAMVFQSYANIRGSFLEYMLETMIFETNHEAAHFTLPSLNIMKKKFNFTPYKVFPEDIYPEYKPEYDNFLHYKENVIEQLRHLNAVLTRPSIIFKDIVLEKEKVQIHPLLFKMTKMMRDKAKDIDQNIFYNQNKNYQSVYIDKLYFDHAIFNLVDNAIKHGYEGTKVYIDAIWKKSNFIVKVINYGSEIRKEDRKRIYQLFFREKDKTKGMGIGLFVVKKICLAFGGNVRHDSERLSEFNIPALSCYIQSEEKDKLLRKVDDALKEKIYKAAKELELDIIDKVVNNNTFIEGPTEFKASINNPTFRNTFTITIPNLI